MGTFLLAMVVRLGVTWQFQGLDAPPKAEVNPDQVEYEFFAAQIAAVPGLSFENNEPSGCRPPGTSFVLLPVYLIAGHSYLAARVWLCLLSSLTCVLTGRIAWCVIGPRVGVCAAALLAVYPGHFYYAMHFPVRSTVRLFLTLAWAFAVEAQHRPNRWYDVLGGLAWGLILIRPNMLLGLFLQIALMRTWVPSWRIWFFRSLAVGVAALALVLPWVIRNGIVMGKPGICTIVGGFTFWGAHNPQVVGDPQRIGSWIAASELMDEAHPLVGSEAAREEAAWSYGKAYLREHPEVLPRLLLAKLQRLVWVDQETNNRMVRLAFNAIWLILAPLTLFGLVLGFRRFPQSTLLLLVPLIATLLTTLIFYGSARCRDGVAPCGSS